MKCMNCKHRLERSNPICPNCSFDMTYYIQERANTRLSTGKKWLLSLLVTASLCTAGGVLLFFSGILSPAKVVVAAAFATTTYQLSGEVTSITEELPLLTHLSQVDQGQSTLTLSSNLAQFPGSAYLTMDLSTSQFMLKGSANSDVLLAATGYLSPQAAILHLEDSDNVVGLDLHTLVDDLSTSSFASSFDMDAISAGYRTDILENMTLMDEELFALLSAAVQSLGTDWDATKLGTETLELNEQTLETTAYELSIDPVAVDAAVTTFVDDFCNSPVFSPYLALLAHEKGMTAETLHAYVAQVVENVLDNVLHLKDATFSVNLYQGRVVLLSCNHEGISYGIGLNPSGDMLSYLSLVGRDSYGIIPYITTNVSLNSGVLSATLDLLGSQSSLLYFTQDSSDNFILSAGDIPYFIATVDTSVQDELTLVVPALDGYLTLTSTLTTLSSDWFSPPAYINLLTMSQTDLMLLAMAISF